MVGMIFVLDILEINVILFLSFVVCFVLLGNMIKFKFVDFKIFIGVLMMFGFGFFFLIGKVLDWVNINCRIGFLNSFFFVIKLNFFGVVVIVRYNGFY